MCAEDPSRHSLRLGRRRSCPCLETHPRLFLQTSAWCAYKAVFCRKSRFEVATIENLTLAAMDGTDSGSGSSNEQVVRRLLMDTKSVEAKASSQRSTCCLMLGSSSVRC